MLNFLLAATLGILSALGIGGGSLLMLWLTLVAQLEYAQARVINLLFFLPGALISTLLHRKTLPIRQLLPALVSGALAAAGFSFLEIPTSWLKKGLGGLFLVTGLRELFYRQRKAK